MAAPMNNVRPDDDPVLWAEVLAGQTSAFEQLVTRYQSLVASVAYANCGNLALSEEVVQEVFWVAWRDRGTLADAFHLRGWLCGIARNLARHGRRRQHRGVRTASLENASHIASRGVDPTSAAIAQEEADLTWAALADLPVAYREPLVLYYREAESVSQLADKLGITAATAKQRIARGRKLLQRRLRTLVESTLARTRPTRALTTAVMAGLASASVSTNSAVAQTSTLVGVGTTVKSFFTGVSGIAIWGSFIGVAAGLFGAWVGVQSALVSVNSAQERRIIRSMTAQMSVLWMASILAIYLLLAFSGTISPHLYVAGLLIAILTPQLAMGCIILFYRGRLRDARQHAIDTGTIDPLKTTDLRHRLRGRVFRSQATFCGLPWIDVAFSDPQAYSPSRVHSKPRVARGWIAGGDVAYGAILAFGGRTFGLVSIGGAAFGLVAIGGLSVGLIAFGGLAAGLMAFGGIAIAGIAFGGLAAGYFAVGGLAVGFDALGGFAAAWDAAQGGAAYSRHFAVGGVGAAPEFNTNAAKQAIETLPLRPFALRYLQLGVAVHIAAVLVFVGPILLLSCFAYERRPEENQSFLDGSKDEPPA